MSQMRSVFFAALILYCATSVVADPGDTTTIVTFNREFFNWADPHVARFEFYDQSVTFSQVTLRITLGCPGSPGDCDPWDRLGHLSVRVPTSDTTYDRFEIARFITPYDITGSGGPGTCSWNYDITAYQTLLHDSVTLSLAITTWINDARGWLITAAFEFIEGVPELFPYRVVNLWDIGYLIYGDPDNPPESHLPMATVPTDSYTESILIRAVCTGHGQGNTNNAAEFSNKWHQIWVGADFFRHSLWREGCAQNPCSPQLGTWPYDRAGWCPGDKVDPWDNTYSNFAPGDPVDFAYEIEPYTNHCRPNNPNCRDGVTCSDCDYNYTGHTEPNYCLAVQAILYREPVSAVEPHGDAGLPRTAVLAQNYPNPFNPSTTIRFDLPVAGQTRLTVYNIRGETVAVLVDSRLTRGNYEATFDGSNFASGVYFYTLEYGNQRLTHKMLLIK
ncbi:T9SS C-terminal target domain-containing protein [candidate division KSB1 bacterium]|nr:MAG: T9SS C-terminal target domain-containing protein [candidate division KSB1 bacterium]